jgi:hypothetical protein
MPSKKLNIARSTNSVPTWGIDFPLLAQTAFLDTDLPQSVTVPGGCNLAIFSYSSGPNVIVNTGSSPEATPILGAAFTDSQARINPPAARVAEGETLFFRSSSTNGDIVSVAFYTDKETG